MELPQVGSNVVWNYFLHRSAKRRVLNILISFSLILNSLKKMVGCFVVGCSSGYKGHKSHLFRAPKSADKEEWIRNIPRREIPFDFSKHAVCVDHFEENFVLKNDEYIIINGENLTNPARQRWTLKSNAVPTKFENSKLSRFYNKNAKRKSPAERSLVINHKRVRALPKVRENPSNVFSALCKSQSQLKLPSKKWMFHQHDPDDLSDPLFFFELGKTEAEKQEGASLNVIKTLILNPDDTFKVTTRGKNVSKSFAAVTIASIENLNDLLSQINKLCLCSGLKGFGSLEAIKGGKKLGNNWRSDNCTSLSSKDRCEQCQLFLKKLRKHNALRKMAQKRRNSKTPASPSKLHAYVNYLKQKNSETTRQLRKNQSMAARTSLELKSMKLKFLKAEQTRILDIIKNADIPDNLKLAISTAFKIAKAKSSKGNRYESDWLLQCLLLRIQSPKAYNYLRAIQMLPLPHPSTIRKLISAMTCNFGFQDFVFDCLKEEYNNKARRDRQGMILFDEIKIREQLEFSKADFMFHGFVDYSEHTEEYFSRTKNKSQLADHGLVFMFRSLNSSVVQPVAVFASKGAAPGFILSKLLISAVLKLEAAGLEVIGSVCDGASTNKSMWHEFGVKTYLDVMKNPKISCSISHPCDETRKLYFLSDTPHLVKCIRNHLMTHRIGMFSGIDVNFQFYVDLYKNDCSMGTLRLAPKLTQNHIQPSCFQKMIVSYATQLFSRTVANAIHILRENGHIEFRKSEGTERFTRIINDFFDAMNGTYKKIGVRKNDDFHQTILKFSDYLSSDTNNFCSTMTLESLRVTVKSTLEILEILFTLGFNYVLTAKLNQDAIENFFGILRNMGGSDDHPTITTFKQLFRLMCIYTPTKMKITGNVKDCPDQKCASSLVEYVNTLRKSSKQNRQGRATERHLMEDKLIQRISDTINISHKPSTTHLLDHDYCKAETLSSIVYHLAGYVAFKGPAFTKCVPCLNSLKSETCPISPVTIVTRLVACGNLTFPSEALHNLITCVESKIHLYDNFFYHNSNPMLDIIMSMDGKFNVGGCGSCNSAELTASIIIFYISVRMYFYVKIYNREHLSNSKKTKLDKKKAKLN